mmetsp:Transcript_122868/g.342396  ORF Transcript_122868/g.342396 Transcript_122868/m.342396 type:complete len:215 (+) Transcript_122868:168-812(+)
MLVLPHANRGAVPEVRMMLQDSSREAQGIRSGSRRRRRSGCGIGNYSRCDCAVLAVVALFVWLPGVERGLQRGAFYGGGKPRGLARNKYDTWGVSPLEPKPQEGEAVPGLRLWLADLDLEDHLEIVNEWCQEMGAAVLVEVVENVEDLAETLRLPPEEVLSLQERGRKAFKVLDWEGKIAPQPDVRPAEDLEGRTMAGSGGGKTMTPGRSAGQK